MIYSPNVIFFSSMDSFNHFCGCCSSLARSCMTATPWTAAPRFLVFHYLSEFGQTHSIELVMHPTILSSVAPFPSCIQSFPASRSFPMSWLLYHMAKGLEFQLLHQSFQWIFKVDFFEKWLVWSPGCPKDCQDSCLKHNSKASIFWWSAVFIIQLSHTYMTTRKTTALTIQTFIGKVIALLSILCLGLSFLSFQGASIS